MISRRQTKKTVINKIKGIRYVRDEKLIWLFEIEKPTPFNPKSTAYVYVKHKEEGSDDESIVDELWGLDIHEDSEDEDLEDEEINVDDDDDDGGDFDAADLPEDMNARCTMDILFLLPVC